MAESESQLNIILGARDRASKVLRKVQRRIGGLSKRIAKFGSVAGVAAAGGLALLGRQQARVIAETDKLAKRLGVSTEAMSKLRGVAEISGIQFNTLSEGIQELQLRLADVRRGAVVPTEGLQAINKTLADFEGLNPAEKFREVAQAINQLPSAGERQFAADALFGGEAGRRLLTLFRQDLDAINKQVERAQASFNRFDAAQVRRATRAIRTMKLSLAAVGRELAIRLSPFIEALSNKIVSLVNDLGGARKVVVNAFEFVTQGIAQAADVVTTLRAAFFGVRAAVLKVLSVIVDGFGNVQSVVVSSINTMLSAVQAVADKLPGIGENIEQAIEKVKEAGKTSVDFTEQFGKELDKSATNAAQRMNELMQVDRSQQVTQFFDDLRDKSRQAAKEMATANQQKAALLSGAQVRAGASAIGSAAQSAGQIAANAAQQFNQFLGGGTLGFTAGDGGGTAGGGIGPDTGRPQSTAPQVTRFLTRGPGGMSSEAKELKKINDNQKKANNQREQMKQRDERRNELLDRITQFNLISVEGGDLS